MWSIYIECCQLKFALYEKFYLVFLGQMIQLFCTYTTTIDWIAFRPLLEFWNLFELDMPQI